MHYAAIKNKEQAVNLLISQGANVNTADKQGVTVLDDATHKGYENIISLLKQSGAKCGTTAFSCKN